MITDRLIDRHAVPAAQQLRDAIRAGNAEQVEHALTAAQHGLRTDATTTALALAVVLAAACPPRPMAELLAWRQCRCDREIRCAECGGCECRAGTCPTACPSELAWEPTVVPGPVRPLARVSLPPAKRPAVDERPLPHPELLDRRCVECGRPTCTRTQRRSSPSATAGRVVYGSHGLCGACEQVHRRAAS